MIIFILAFIIEFIFSLSLVAANIYCFKNKKYLYLFIPCMIYLPQYYGFDVPGPFPVISVVRVMYLIFYLYAILNRRQPLIPNIKSIKSMPVENYFIVAYFLLRIISNLYYVPVHTDSIKVLLSIIFENIFLLYALYLLAPTKEELFKVIKIFVNVTAVMFFLGVIESITGLRFTNALYTVSSDIFNDYYYRMGFLRATTTLSMPNYFSNVCLFVAPLIFYLHKVTNHKRYLLYSLLNILALIHAGSRASMVFYIGVWILYLAFNVLNKDFGYVKEILKSTCIVLIALILWIGIYSAIDDHARYFYAGTGKSLLNMAGFEFDLNEGAPEDVKGYGENAHSPTYSRVYQISGIKGALEKNPVFGLGAGCFNRGEVIYNYRNHLVASKSIDSAPVEILTAEGLLGFTGYILLFIGLIVVFIGRRFNPIKNTNQLVLSLVLLSYVLSMVVTANMYDFLMLIIFFFYYEKTYSNEQ